MAFKAKIESKKKTSSLKEVITNELERLGNGGSWVWMLFLMCVTPNILNGFHVSSYVVLEHVPKMWCSVEDLELKSWSTDQIRNITSDGLTSNGCTIWNRNYTELSGMSYEEALLFTQSQIKPEEISCPKGYRHQYDETDLSIVSEWDLVCENSVWRTSAQTLVSFGKFFGASIFGILSDKYGRRKSFIMGTICYIAGGLITTASPWYLLFLFGRFCLEAASCGLFYPAFSLLIENIGVKHRSWMGTVFPISYPIGMLFFALSAYLVHPWRYLQLTLTIPSFLLIISCYFMIESPRWLLMKNREADAYRIVFKKKMINIPEPGQLEEKNISLEMINIPEPGQLEEKNISLEMINIPEPGQLEEKNNYLEKINIPEPGQLEEKNISLEMINIPEPGQLEEKNISLEMINIPEPGQLEETDQNVSVWEKLKSPFSELRALYGPSKMWRMTVSCHFMFFVTSLCYYVTALNADNLAANRYLYVAFTGCVDIPAYILPMILFKFMGRRTAAFGLFTISSVSFLIVLGIPKDWTELLVFFAMFGRFGISSVYSIITLHTAELFPTHIRNSALGTSSTMAHLASIIAPYVVDVLGRLVWYIPTTICGCSVILAGNVILTLPETKTKNLSDNDVM